MLSSFANLFTLQRRESGHCRLRVI